MKIQPINNIRQNSNFKAKFPKQDINQFLTEIEFQDRCAVPQLYTLLEFVKNLPAKIAEIKSFGTWYQIHIDGKSLTNERKYMNAYHALYDSIVIHKNTMVQNSPIERLSEFDFENRFYQNANKTKQDIENVFDV